MLDFGFSEILLTSAIALVVLGPERLPKVARQVGNWMGRARAMARQLSEQLDREIGADELIKLQAKSARFDPPHGPAPDMIATPSIMAPPSIAAPQAPPGLMTPMPMPMEAPTAHAPASPAPAPLESPVPPLSPSADSAQPTHE